MTLPASKNPRPKTCSVCKTEFTPTRPLQKVCGPVCALAHAKAKESRQRKAIEKVERREIRAAKERIKSRAEYLKEAQAVMNRYVRLRDAHLGCVSCDKPATWPGQWHCSHFRSVGAAPHIRFNLWNMHKACSICNNHLSGNIAEYLPRLIERIGAERVEALQCDSRIVRYDIPYLKRLKAVFAKKCRRLEKIREAA